MENKSIYDLKNLLFVAVVNNDKELEKEVKKAIRKFLKSKIFSGVQFG